MRASSRPCSCTAPGLEPLQQPTRLLQLAGAGKVRQLAEVVLQWQQRPLHKLLSLALALLHSSVALKKQMRQAVRM